MNKDPLHCLIVLTLITGSFLIALECIHRLGGARLPPRGVLASLYYVNNEVSLLCTENLEYLLVSALLAVETYFFLSVLLRMLLRGTREEERNSEPREEGKPGIGSVRLLYFLIIISKYSLMMIGDLKRTLGLKEARRISIEPRRISLNYDFVIAAFVLGTFTSMTLLMIYEASRPLFWASFLASVLLLTAYMIILGCISELDKEAIRRLGIWYEDDKLVVRYGVSRPAKLEVNEKVLALGLSVSSGVCGVIMTLGGTVLEASLAFTIVPITFDMLSLLTALMEFLGLRKAFSTLRNMGNSWSGLVAILPVISWSLYLVGALIVILANTGFHVPTSTALNLISGMWILLATLLSIVEEHIRPRGHDVILSMLSSLLPLMMLSI